VSLVPECVAISGTGRSEGMGSRAEAERGDDTGTNGRHAAPGHGIGRLASERLAL